MKNKRTDDIDEFLENPTFVFYRDPFQDVCLDADDPNATRARKILYKDYQGNNKIVIFSDIDHLDREDQKIISAYCDDHGMIYIKDTAAPSALLKDCEIYFSSAFNKFLDSLLANVNASAVEQKAVEDVLQKIKDVYNRYYLACEILGKEEPRPLLNMMTEKALTYLYQLEKNTDLFPVMYLNLIADASRQDLTTEEITDIYNRVCVFTATTFHAGKAFCSNPTIPAKLLLNMAKNYPREVFSNAMVAIDSLENSTVIKSLCSQFFGRL